MSIETALQGTIKLLAVGQEVYTYIVRLMDSYQGKGTGAEKKAIVLDLARDFILDLGKNWDSWAKYISDFIDSAKSIYNSVKKILK